MNRDQISQLKEEIKFVKDELKSNKKRAMSSCWHSFDSKLVKDVEEDFHKLMDDLSLKRVVYHSGALIGKNVKKTLLEGAKAEYQQDLATVSTYMLWEFN